MRFPSRPCRRGILVILALLVPWTANAGGAEVGGIRLFVRPSAPVAEPGKQAEIEVELRDLHGASAKVSRPFEVEVSLGDGSKTTASFAAGQTKATARLTPKRTGLLEIRATHREMLPGTGFLKVAPPGTPTLMKRVQDEDLAPGSLPLEGATNGRRLAKKVEKLEPVSPPTPPPEPVVTLRVSPNEGVLANGQDTANVVAYVVGDTVPQAPLSVELVTSAGHLNPPVLRIPKGGFESDPAVLTSSQPGPVEIEYINSQPLARFDGDRKLRVQFTAPVEGLQVEPSPSRLTLADDGEIVVHLLGPNGTPIATDVGRHVSLALREGSGTLAPSEFDIPAGGFEQRVRFTPTGIGNVTIAATTAGLLERSATIQVSAPGLLLFLSAAGGAVGGLVSTYATRTRKKKVLLRTLVGVVTGFFLSWAASYGLTLVLSREGARNPMSVAAVALLGGWLGTSVFGSVAKKLGLGE